jgi:preprotein translocase SecE subunit
MKPLVEYLKAVRAELAHVSWPSVPQAVGYTLLVIGISLGVAALLGGFDFLFTRLIERLIRAFGN